MSLTTDFIASKKGGSPYLMVVMHGLGDSMEGYRPLVQELAVPEMNYLLVNAPDHYLSGFSWYDIYDNPEPGIKRSRQMVIDLLESQQKEGFAYKNIFLFGFSQGCLMATEVGGRFHSVLGGIIGISGYVNNPAELIAEKSPVAEKQKFLITHGDSDPIIPIQKSKPIFESLAGNGFNIQWVEFAKDHTIAGYEELYLIRDFINQRIKSIEEEA